jgi:hypothetical protein
VFENEYFHEDGLPVVARKTWAALPKLLPFQ